MRQFFIPFVILLAVGHFIARVPVGTGPVWAREVQLAVVAVMVVLPYHSWRKINYYHDFPIVVWGLLCVGLLLWSGTIRLPSMIDFRPLALLVFHGLMSLMTCMACTQLRAEWRRPIA